MTLDDFQKSLADASKTMGAKVLGFMRICTAKKAIRATQRIGTVEQASPYAENHSMRNGSASENLAVT
jgi:hypothetical protein